MKEEDMERMWLIDCSAQVGNEISQEDREFFNNNYDSMINQLEEFFNHWKYHTSKFLTK